MFWNNLSKEERAEYYILLNKVKKHIAWIFSEPNRRKFKKNPEKFQETHTIWLTTKPNEPNDSELIRYEFLSMKGWGMTS